MTRQRTREDQLREDTDALRLATREAHEATKDLRAAIKEANEVRSALVNEIAAVITHTIDEAVKVGLEGYSTAIGQAIDDATEAVYERFDTIAATLLGVTEKDKRVGNVSIADQAKLVAKLVRGGGPEDMTDEEQKVIDAVREQAKRRFG